MIFLLIYSFLLLFDFYPLSNKQELLHHVELITRPHTLAVTITETIVIFWGLSIEIDEFRQV